VIDTVFGISGINVTMSGLCINR